MKAAEQGRHETWQWIGMLRWLLALLLSAGVPPAAQLTKKSSSKPGGLGLVDCSW